MGWPGTHENISKFSQQQIYLPEFCCFSWKLARATAIITAPLSALRLT